jgi:hypothetical protein
MITVAKQTPQEHRPRVGCHLHGTPEGQRCDGCQRQRELFSRAEAARQTRNRRWS